MGILFDLLVRDSIPGAASRGSLEKIAHSFGLELITNESDEDLRARICDAKEKLRNQMECSRNKALQEPSGAPETGVNV